jgi:hypothetical protein
MKMLLTVCAPGWQFESLVNLMVAVHGRPCVVDGVPVLGAVKIVPPWGAAS